MTDICNPKAHDNQAITREDALRKLILISMLIYKIVGTIVNLSSYSDSNVFIALLSELNNSMTYVI